MGVGTNEEHADALAAIAGDYNSDESERVLRTPEEETVAPASVDSGAAAAAAAPSGAASAAESAASDDGRALENDELGPILTLTEKEGGREELRRQGCSFSVNGRAYTFDLHLNLFPVPANGSCFAIAILRAVAGLDFVALKKLPSLANVNWSAVEVWAGFGKSLEAGQDQECKDFRVHACRTLLSKLENCRSFFNADMSSADISTQNFKKALQTAAGLGIALPKEENMDRAHHWIVSLLHHKTHFAEEHWQALLAVDLGGCLGILVAVRSKRHKAETAGEIFVHRLPSYQPMIDSNAKFLVAVVQQSEQKLSDDSAGASRRTRRRCAPLTPEQQTLKEKVEAQWAKCQALQQFQVQYGTHHFQGASIVNNTGSALVVDELSSSSHGADPVSPVRVVAETEKVADTIASVDPRYAPYLPSEEEVLAGTVGNAPMTADTMLWYRKFVARSTYRRNAGKDSDKESTEEDEAGGPKSQAGLGGDRSIAAVNAITGSAAPRAKRNLHVANDGTPATVSKLTRAGGLDSPGRAKGSSPAADSRSNMQRYSSSHAVVHTRHRPGEAYTIVCSLRSYRRDRASFGSPHGFATVFECD